DGAVDLILETSATFPRERRLQHQLTDLVARVNAMELAALREGDGFTDQREEHAAIDDLEHVETFPALIDPKLKKAVEDDIKEFGLRQTWWIDERNDPEKATRAAARHLKDLFQEFGDWYLAMAAYNSGPVRVQRALEKTGADNFWSLAERRALPKETINYVPNILALTIIGKNPEKYGFNVRPEAPLEIERVQVSKATDLRVIAEAINLPVEELRGLNTHVLR